jgi:hypothetical protein
MDDGSQLEQCDCGEGEKRHPPWLAEKIDCRLPARGAQRIEVQENVREQHTGRRQGSARVHPRDEQEKREREERRAERHFVNDSKVEDGHPGDQRCEECRLQLRRPRERRELRAEIGNRLERDEQSCDADEEPQVRREAPLD